MRYFYQVRESRASADLVVYRVDRGRDDLDFDLADRSIWCRPTRDYVEHRRTSRFPEYHCFHVQCNVFIIAGSQERFEHLCGVAADLDLRCRHESALYVERDCLPLSAALH